MKYLIVGLGNIGAEYDSTRHNIGFEILDYMAEKKSLTWESVRYGHMVTYKHKGRSLLLLKPNTYMNLSGLAVNYHLKKEKIPLERMLVILDDLNLEFGRKRIRAKGSDGGHNGLKNIQANLGTTAYPRLRIGIGNSYGKGQQVDFVLGKWDKEEQERLPEILSQSSAAVEAFSSIGLQNTMNTFNN